MTNRRFPTLTLLEASQDYEAMFKDILARDPSGSIRPEAVASEIQDAISWAKKVLKKQDRVVWYLRYVKAVMLAATNGGSDKDRMDAATNFIRRYDESATASTCQMVMADSMRHKFEHWFSLDYVKIQDYVFGKKSVRSVEAELRELEREYVERAKAKITHDDPSLQGTEKLIDCGGGWWWVNLHRAACEVEGKAMGHCGNSPRRDYDDTILSLRKFKEKKDGTSYWEPHLTFTMDEGGELLEMKGRGNKKPAPQYHPMIAKLLLYKTNGDWLINALVGGSWLPENDFSMDDFSPDLKKKVLSQRPDLGDLFEYVDYGGDPNSTQLTEKLRLYCKQRPLISYSTPQWFDWMGSGHSLVFNCRLGHGAVREAVTGVFGHGMHWAALQSDPIATSFSLFHREKDLARYRENVTDDEIAQFQEKWAEYVVDKARAIMEEALGDAKAFCKIEWPYKQAPRAVPIKITDPVAFVQALKGRLQPPMKNFIHVVNYLSGAFKMGEMTSLDYEVDAAFSRLVNKRGDTDPPSR